MTLAAYPAARTAAARNHAHFARQATAYPHPNKSAAVPDSDAFEAMIEAAFWASLRREEGHMPRHPRPHES